MDKPDPRTALAEIRRFSARFRNPDLEAEFLARRTERHLRQVRAALAVGVVMVLGFAVLDYLVLTESRTLAVTIRLAGGLPSIGFVFALTFVPLLQRNTDLFAWIIVPYVTMNYLALNVVSDAPDVYLSGYIIILFFMQILLPLSFPAMLWVGTGCTLGFALAIPAIRDLPIGHLLTIYSQYIATLIAGGFAVYLINVYRRIEFLDSKKIAEQRQQYFGLLTRILPRDIVVRMENGEPRIADQVPSAAVLFADIVGFTDMASRHPPERVLDTLDTLFASFDRLVEQHGLEKIKTIGDAYMVAGGVPTSRPGFLADIADLALDLLDAAADQAGPDGRPLELRVGIHVGPLVAGVIGDSRFGYDLWGDTVNIASRMQSLGEPGRVQVSDAVQRELAGAYRFEPLGEIEAKGLGRIPTWYLLDHNDREY